MHDKLNQRYSHASFIDGDQTAIVEAAKKIKELDYKVQGLLLWSTIFALWSYLILIFRIFKIYAVFKGDKPGLLTLVMFTSYILLGAIIFIVWQGIKYKKSAYKKVSKAYIDYQILKMNGQRKLIYTYLIAYTTLLIGSTVFFFLDRRDGIFALLSTTVPIALLAYVLGLYFLIRLNSQKRTLDDMEQKINQFYLLDKIGQN